MLPQLGAGSIRIQAQTLTCGVFFHIQLGYAVSGVRSRSKQQGLHIAIRIRLETIAGEGIRTISTAHAQIGDLPGFGLLVYILRIRLS